MNLDQARAVVVQEARELLAEMDAALLHLEHSGFEAEQVNAVFRAVHTIKGSAGLFALDHLVSFCHTLESVLEQVRAGDTELDGALLSVLLTCGDYIAGMITEVEQGREHHDPDPDLRVRLLDQLSGYLQAAAAEPHVQPAAAEPQHQTEVLGSPYWHISLRPFPQVLSLGLEPISFLRYLSAVGRIVQLRTLTHGIPSGAAFDPQLNYLSYEIQFECEAGQAAIEDVFTFLLEHCELNILPPHSPPEAYTQLFRDLPEGRAELLEMLIACGALAEVDQALLVPVGADERDAVADKTESTAAPKSKGEQLFIKVEVSKLDQLINLVGELVIADAAARAAQHGSEQTRQEASEVVTTLVEDIRDVSLALRMVAIGEVFQRFPRVVRDLSREMGKDIELHITGAETELDKSMVEKLSDPLLHLVRNAIDHGVESAHERLAAGKPARSQLRLNAFHESGSVVIEISDDGRGLDRARIHAKAVERGLLQPDQEVSDSDLFELIFRAGFSTAEAVSNLSGRGVGLDVVRTNIEKLRGEVELFSRAGQGTTVRVRLPLTLAIIEGFQVRVAGEAFVLPLEQVIECVDLSGQVGDHELLDLRGEALPFVRLRQLFGKPAAQGLRESLLVVQYGSSRAGIVVDQLMGELQAVIKPLGQLFAQNAFLSGSTILGDGSVALILDVAQLIKRASASAYTWHSEHAG
ncbi:chemotaxis protein CheA [Pseudomonas sp. TTU2014-080ASC]|uniref:chemotaxis protein CheA n=1 Tax=Pseudomonas sp. TTU2014-080ASC TaxID=1729724 RepID=UPI00071839D1|nr:chemotaxis protein CheA [Pseudomonas sp. TTU2014-080ASC]KRW58521.1 chemotaxis protein CheA [Pseudomonas sp. TTU2014-080ASC]